MVRGSPAFIYQNWQAICFPRQTVEPTVWEVKAAQVYLARQGRPTDRTYWLIVARNRATGEYKYFVSNAPPKTNLELLLKVAFRRADMEHLFRVVKSEVGLDHFEGRRYVGLMRHMILCQLIILFLAEQTARRNAALVAAVPAPVDVTQGGKKVQGPAQDHKKPTPPGIVDRHSHPAARHDGANRGLPELALCPLACASPRPRHRPRRTAPRILHPHLSPRPKSRRHLLPTPPLLPNRGCAVVLTWWMKINFRP